MWLNGSVSWSIMLTSVENFFKQLWCKQPDFIQQSIHTDSSPSNSGIEVEFCFIELVLTVKNKEA